MVVLASVCLSNELMENVAKCHPLFPKLIPVFSPLLFFHLFLICKRIVEELEVRVWVLVLGSF